MKQQFLFLLIVISVLGCNPDTVREVDIDSIGVSTTDASELYFKNMRRSEYDVEERKEQGLDIYTPENREDVKYPMIELSIVHNWRNDNAFIMIQPNVYLTPGSQIKIGDTNITFESANMLEQAKVGGIIYNALLKDEQFYLVTGDETQPFLADGDDRKLVKSCLHDFFKLVEAF